MKRGIQFTGHLPSNDKKDIHSDTQIDGGGGFMKYAVEMGLSAMIYIPRSIKIGSGIQKLMAERYTDTHRQHEDSISFPSFLLKNKESNLKRNLTKISCPQ
jgi:hypothetical protein